MAISETLKARPIVAVLTFIISIIRGITFHRHCAISYLRSTAWVVQFVFLSLNSKRDALWWHMRETKRLNSS